MKKIAGVILALIFSGCYTQLQLAGKDTISTPVYVPPAPIIIVLPQPCPVPHPRPPHHPIIVEPAEQVTMQAPPVENNRIRTNGSTRDDNDRTRRR